MPDPVSFEAPIVVPASPANAQIASGLRSAVLVIGAITTLAGFVSHRDMAGFLTYVQSSDFVLVLGIASTVGSVAWGQWKLRKRELQSAKMATLLPDSIATTK